MENILQIGLGERSGDWVTHKESKPSRKEPHRKRSSAAQALHLIYGVIAERRIICHSGRSPSFAWRYRQNGASYAIAQEDNGAQQRSTNAQLKMAWLEKLPLAPERRTARMATLPRAPERRIWCETGAVQHGEKEKENIIFLLPPGIEPSGFRLITHRFNHSHKR